MTVTLIFMTFSASAETAAIVTKLQVELKNGTKDLFVLSDAPEITFEGNDCLIECNSFTTSYAMADILQANFIDDFETSETMVADRVTINLTDTSKAIVSGLLPGAQVSVYGIDGTIEGSALADQTGTAEIDLSELKRGTVYIISIDSENYFKLIKK